MNTIQVYFKYNKKAISTTITEDPLFWRISFPYYKPLVDRLKESTESRQFDFETKEWVIKRTERNEFIIKYLMGEPVYHQYGGTLTSLRPSSELWYHQKKMYSHILSRKRCIIAGEMRVGKTFPTLLAIKDKGVKNAWWIAPKSALNGLKRELIKWHFPYTIYLMTYDKFRRIYNGSDTVPSFIVFDECQKLKNPQSKQGRLARELASQQRKIHGDDAHIVLLSGTPSPKDPGDWWNLTEICQPGFLREGNHHILKQNLGEFEKVMSEADGHSYHKLIRWKKEEVERLHRRLQGLVEVFLKKDCLDLPEKVYTLRAIPMSDDYKSAIEFVKNTEISTVQVLNKLRQISDGFLYQEGEYDEVSGSVARLTTYFPINPKINQLITDLEELEDMMECPRLVVYCGFQATADKIVEACIKQGWSILKIDGRGWDTYNTPHSQEFCLSEMDGSLNTNTIDKLVVVAQADAASTGLEFSASNQVIYFSNSFDGAARMQSEDRPYSNNMDKKRGLEIIDYIHLPTDKLVRDNLLMKKTLQSITLGEVIKTLEGIV